MSLASRSPTSAGRRRPGRRRSRGRSDRRSARGPRPFNRASPGRPVAGDAAPLRGPTVATPLNGRPAVTSFGRAPARGPTSGACSGRRRRGRVPSPARRLPCSTGAGPGAVLGSCRARARAWDPGHAAGDAVDGGGARRRLTRRRPGLPASSEPPRVPARRLPPPTAAPSSFQNVGDSVLEERGSRVCLLFLKGLFRDPTPSRSPTPSPPLP